MTKEEAIKILMHDVSLIISHTIDGTHEKIEQATKCNEAIVLGVDALKEQKTDRWIPCNERLPEKNGEYLVTVKKGYRQLGIWIGIENNWSEVIAWMPIPRAIQRGKRCIKVQLTQYTVKSLTKF